MSYQSLPCARFSSWAPLPNTAVDRPQDDQDGGLCDSIGDWASSTKEAAIDSAEDVGEWAGEVNEEYSTGTRALVALTVASAVGEAALGSVGIVAAEPATSVAGAVLFVHGADTVERILTLSYSAALRAKLLFWKSFCMALSTNWV